MTDPAWCAKNGNTKVQKQAESTRLRTGEKMESPDGRTSGVRHHRRTKRATDPQFGKTHPKEAGDGVGSLLRGDVDND